MTFRAQVLSGIRWTAGARFVGQLFMWALTLIVIRLLSPADYGLLAMATMFIAVLSIFGELGMGSALVQQPEIDDAMLQRVFGLVLVIHVVLAGVLALSAPWVAGFFSEPRLVAVLRTLSLQFIIAAFVVVPDALLQRQMKFKGRSLIDLSAVIVGGTTSLTIALAGHGVWALVWGTLVTQALKAIGLNLLVASPRRPRFSLTGVRPLLRFGGHMTVTQLLWVAFSQSDALICGRLLGKEALGVYSVALHLASLPIQRIAGIVNQIAFPAFARLQGDIARVGAHVLRATRILSLIAFPILWGISSVAPEIVDVILGPKWRPAALPLQVLGVIMPLRVIAYFLPNATQGIGRSDILLANSIWALLIAPPFLWYGASRWGLIGLCVAWLIASPLLFLQGMLRTLPVLGITFRQLTSAMAPSLYAGALMYGAVSAARRLASTGTGTVVDLLVLVMVGFVAYAASSWLFNRKGVREAMDILQGIVRWRRAESSGK